MGISLEESSFSTLDSKESVNKVRSEDIFGFELQGRDYQWVEFQNVSLESDVRTRVAVAVLDSEASHSTRERRQ